MTDKFRKNNYNAGFKYTPGGRLPPRRGTTEAKTEPMPIAKEEPSSPTATGTSPTSPSRRIVQDFKPFGASSTNMSVFGAPMLPTGPGGGMFGSAGRTPNMNSMRGRGAEDDDDDDDDAGTQLRRDAISLDQARRIATQSVFRAGRLPL